MKAKYESPKKESSKSLKTEEEKRKAFVDLIAQIIVDISFKEYQEEKSRQNQNK